MNIVILPTPIVLNELKFKIKILLLVEKGCHLFKKKSIYFIIKSEFIFWSKKMADKRLFLIWSDFTVFQRKVRMEVMGLKIYLIYIVKELGTTPQAS